MKLSENDCSSLYLKDIKNFIGLKKVGDRQTARKRDMYMVHQEQQNKDSTQELTVNNAVGTQNLKTVYITHENLAE